MCVGLRSLKSNKAAQDTYSDLIKKYPEIIPKLKEFEALR